MTEILEKSKSQKLSRNLLCLGSNFETIPFIRFCQENGFTCHVCDPSPNSPGKEHADVSVDIDATDTESLKEYCKKHTISTIVLGVADQLVSAYATLCSDLGIPGYATNENARIFSSKHEFNKLLIKNNLLPIPGYSVSLPKLDNQIDNIIKNSKPPWIVKPTNSVSGKGLFVVDDAHLLKNFVIKSMVFSNQKIILIEKLIRSPEVSLYFNMNSTDFSYILSDKYSANTGLGNVTSLQVYPSKSSKLIEGQIIKNFKSIFKQQQIDKGVLLISAFVDNDTFYWYDPGFRLQGEPSDVHEFFHLGSKSYANLLSIACSDFNEPAFNYKSKTGVSATIWFLLNPGKISAILGFEKLADQDNVLEIRQRLNVGDIVKYDDIGTEKQVFSRVCIWSKDREELKNCIKRIRKNCRIEDENGVNLLLKLNDWQKL